MNKFMFFMFLIFSTQVRCEDFPPFVMSALNEHDCDNYDRFGEVNETSEYPFQYGYGSPETVIVWCKWKTEAHLLILPRSGEESSVGCPMEIQSKYIFAGGLTLVNRKLDLSNFKYISNNSVFKDGGKTEGKLIHSNWAGAGTYLYCHGTEWLYFNHD
ncbi:hypothetical protein [Microbulbifer thermotolerans]|uniref:hypothetical protein n=1 Tax=Microbulbifer thermotolerans TaxID=252514 RepID=UPI00224AA64D|nr:hypothetical protein [Microbulbifer thermotolerans]MCX2781183.1 hypothetical protein [Microbulbifer thermotolerans]MCX2803453.1 hypothetical protein [Microbulbifer thermotolerans]